jgi:hypothetical protein
MTKLTADMYPPGYNFNYKPKTDIIKKLQAAVAKVKEKPVKERLPEVWANVLVTKEMAEDLQELNVKNRHPSEDRAANFADVQKKGKWKVNGDTLRIDWDLRFIDGQHRLGMIIKTGIPAYFIIVVGLEPDAITTIDNGKKRTAADWAAFEGFSSPTVLAAAVRLILMLRSGLVAGRVANLRVDIEDVAAFLKNQTQRKKMLAHLELAQKTLHNEAKFLTTGQWAALSYFVVEEHNEQRGKAFIEKLASGADLSKTGTNHQIFNLRKKLENIQPETKKKGKRTVKANSADMLMIKFKFINKAWNAFATGKRLDELKLTEAEMDAPRIPNWSE